MKFCVFLAMTSVQKDTKEYREQRTENRELRTEKHKLNRSRQFFSLLPDAHRQRVIVDGIDYRQLRGLHLGPRAGGVDGEVHRVDGVAQSRRQDVADHRLQLLFVLIHRLDGAHAVHGNAYLRIWVYKL